MEPNIRPSLHAFNPTVRQIDPPSPPRLAEGVVGALARNMNAKHAWGPFKTLALGIISGGLIPLIFQQNRFREFIVAERTHLWHFAEWMRIENPSPETEKLQQAISRLRFRMSLWIGSLLLAALAVAWAWSSIAKLAPITPNFIFNYVERLPKIITESASVPRVLLSAAGFQILLVGAHLISVYQVIAHTTDIGKIVALYNSAAQKHQLATAQQPIIWKSFNFAWILVTVAAALLGSLWGVPMMLAACAQAGYITGSGRRMRLAMSGAAYDELASRRPAIEIAMPAPLRGACVRETCAAKLPAGANFCPRCGVRAAVGMSNG